MSMKCPRKHKGDNVGFVVFPCDKLALTKFELLSRLLNLGKENELPVLESF